MTIFMETDPKSGETQICAKSGGLRFAKLRSVCTLYGLLLHRFVEVILYTRTVIIWGCSTTVSEALM